MALGNGRLVSLLSNRTKRTGKNMFALLLRGVHGALPHLGAFTEGGKIGM